jgi:DNA segregation ATPase FtsK/SpoIIIE, S-DNA-T family
MSGTAVSMTMRNEQPGRGDMASSAEFNFWCALNDLPFRLSLNEWPDGGREWDVEILDAGPGELAIAYGTGQSNEAHALLLAQAFIAGVEWAEVERGSAESDYSDEGNDDNAADMGSAGGEEGQADRNAAADTSLAGDAQTPVDTSAAGDEIEANAGTADNAPEAISTAPETPNPEPANSEQQHSEQQDRELQHQESVGPESLDPESLDPESQDPKSQDSEPLASESDVSRPQTLEHENHGTDAAEADLSEGDEPESTEEKIWGDAALNGVPMPAAPEVEAEQDQDQDQDFGSARDPMVFSAGAARAESTVQAEYVRPDNALLQSADHSDIPTMDEPSLARNAKSLETVLSNFRVRGEIMDVRPGPVITLYEFEPRPGTKSSTIINLADDIARSMSAVTARIAVVPGRSVIGVELPNPARETVYLSEIVGSDSYRYSQARLPLALGKDIGGEPVVMDLATMPHLLIAGTTGSGKSVGINTMILSLLFRHTPDQCRLIMIDPKMLELSIYDGIPHLLTPVVTDPKKAVVALRWAVREMESRYKMMSALGVRNVDTYNRKVSDLKERGEMIRRQVQVGFDKETRQPVMEEHEAEPVELPYIVIVVDEMADLMLMAGKDIEAVIQRLAQMARAAGIHLIMATQRPSVDVITGTIKANFPTRISFQVTSKIDSRTILGEAGAEQLLGQGDMLSLAPGGRITRVHGAFVADAEVERIAGYLRSQGEPEYMHTITEEDGEDVWESTAAGMDGDGNGGDTSSGDDLYDRAVAVVRRENKVSVSFIQRHLQVGYNRAATLVEKMEVDGLIGPANHVGKREILMGRSDR